MQQIILTVLQYWQMLNHQRHEAWLVHAGKQRQKRGHINVIGWQDIDDIK